MANVKISELPVATTLGTTDVVPIVQGGITKQASFALIPLTVTPEHFGAAGDGITDDTVALQAAYTYLAGLTRPGWLVLRNQYKTTSALSIASDYIRTLGEGGIILPSGVINTFEVGPSNQTRQNVIFDGVAVQHTTSTVDIIKFLGGTHLCKVMNCWFEGATGNYNTGYGVNFAGGIAFNNNDRIEGTFFRWLNKGIKDGAAQVNLNIDTNRFANLNNTAVEIQVGGLSRIQSCNFETCCAGQTTAPVVAIGDGSAGPIGRVVVEDCHFEDNGGTALNGNLCLKINKARTIHVLSNRFYAGANYPTLKALRSDTCNGLFVDGNEYSGFASGAVDIPSGVSNTSVVYLANILQDGQEFTASGSNGITLFGYAGGNWNLSLGDAAGANSFVIKDSGGNNLFFVDSLGNVKGPSANSFNVKLGDAAGANALAVKDSSGNNVFLAFSNGKVQNTGSIVAGGDTGGVASTNALSNVSDISANSTGVGSIKFKGVTSRDSTGFIKIYIGTTAYYVPAFSAITG